MLNWYKGNFMVGTRNIIDNYQSGEIERLLANSREFRKMVDEGEQVLQLFPYLTEDIFYALYQENFKLLPLEKTPGARLSRLVVEQLMKSWEFKRARAFTRASLMGAAMAAMYFAKLVLDTLNSGIIETANEIFCSEEELQDALLQKKVSEKIAGVAAGEGVHEIADLYLAAVNHWDLFIEEKTKHLRSLAARLLMQWNTSGRRDLGKSGSGEQGGKQGRIEVGADGVGANKGVWTKGELSNHLKVVELYAHSPKLKRVAQRVGRLKEVKALKSGRDLADDAAEVSGIDYGNDLTLLVPEEWVEYFAPSRRIRFRKRYVDESLCQYDLKGKRRKEKGSMIICLDNSGSMQGPKEETGKAVAIALMEVAMAQKRDFVAIMFGGPDDEMKIFEFPQGRCTFDQLVEIGEHFLCSAGTDFEKPLQEAVRYLEKDKYPAGDIVFITDGVCSVSPEFLEKYKLQKKDKRFRTTAVLVNYGQVSTAPVEAFSDDLLWSKDLKGIDVVGQLFERMQSG